MRCFAEKKRKKKEGYLKISSEPAKIQYVLFSEKTFKKFRQLKDGRVCISVPHPSFK